MDCNAKRFSHYPLKKRPFQFDIEDAPEDLSVKRPKIEKVTKEVSDLKSDTYIPTPVQRENSLPHLANFYFQLFQANAMEKHAHNHLYSYETANTTSIIPSTEAFPNSHYLQKYPLPLSPPEETATKDGYNTAKLFPIHVISSEDSQLSSPRSISSEDSGVCLSEEEVESVETRNACNNCGKSFASVSDLCKHKQLHCSALTTKEFADIDIVESRNVYNENRNECNNCGKTYSTASGLCKHKQLHCSTINAKEFTCKHCSKTYTTIGALKMHVKTHTLPCKCHLCGKAFSRPWLLQGHIRTHTGEKPFQCGQCDRSFADRSNLRAHLQTHAQIKKYACTGCTKTFSRMSLLNKHKDSSCPGKVQTSS